MLCAVPSRLPKMRGEKKIKDAGRDASCLSDTSPRRAGDRSVWPGPLGRRTPAVARADLSVFARVDTGAEARLGTPICKQA